MTIPSPDAIQRIRSKSLESNCSTESLTSFLDHDSYNSASEVHDDITSDAAEEKNPTNEEKSKQPSEKQKRYR